MSKERSNFLDSTGSDLAQLPNPIEIINAMIDLRVPALLTSFALPITEN